MKKPDRFERMVKERMEKDGGLWSDSAADLLRKEHAWMRRMVRAMHAISEDMELSKRGFKDLMIEELKQRRK